MNKVILTQIKVNYKKVLKEMINFALENGATTEEIKTMLLEGGSLVGLNKKIELLNNPHEVLMRDEEKMRKYDSNYEGLKNLSGTDIQVLKDEIEVLIELLNEYCQPIKLVTRENGKIEVQETNKWTIENMDKKYIRAKNFVLAKYEDKKQYFYIKDLMQELKDKFKVTKKEFLEIILPRLKEEKRIMMQYLPMCNSKTVYYIDNGTKLRATEFAITDRP